MQRSPTVGETERPHTSNRSRSPMDRIWAGERGHASGVGGTGRYAWLMAMARARADHRASEHQKRLMGDSNSTKRVA